MSNPGVYQYYPSGYRTPIGSGVRPDVIGDSEIDALWQEYRTNDQVVGTWDFQKRLIEAAKRLYGNIPLWLIAQQDNPQITPAQKYLLKDTVNYVLKGRREVDLTAHDMMITMERASGSTVVFKDKLADGLNYKSNDLIAQWTRQPTGVMDLLYTTHLVFGSLRATLV